jgi:translation initiation factor 1 (eIF-1/SUI1)
MAGSFGDLLKQAGLEASAAGKADAPEATQADSADADAFTHANKVVVRRERKGHGGKTVTRISGILTGREALAQRLKKQMGVGARVDGETLVLHGDQRERVARWLESHGLTIVRA